MDFERLKALTRELADDTVAGGGAELWTDDFLEEKLNEAEREACIRAKLLQDIEAPVAELELTEGDRIFALSPLVIDVLNAKIDGRREEVDPVAIEHIWAGVSGGGWPTAFALMGEPSSSTGRKIVFDRAVPQDATLKMLVHRFPLEPMADDADEPEIAPQHHDALPYWALYLAFLKRDIDAEDPERAERFRKMFEARFGIRVDANVERKQRRHRAPVVRPAPYP